MKNLHFCIMSKRRGGASSALASVMGEAALVVGETVHAKFSYPSPCANVLGPVLVRTTNRKSGAKGT